MSKVWVVVYGDWENTSICGVFSDQAAANDFRARLDQTIESRDALGVPSYDVEVFDLDEPAGWTTDLLTRQGPPPK